jgi:sterol desaturase/sphingolipid hydroxylase (fatty acid hydroxylase superfamily)
LLLCLERIAPLRRRVSSFVRRLLINLGMSALAFLAAATLVRPAAMAALHWSSGKPFGLLLLTRLPPAAQIIAGFLLLDLTFYWWHLANHRVRFLWRFHNVHHLDPDLDVSTGFRFHFGEVAMSAGFRAVQVTLIGVSLPAFAAYEIVFQANTLFHHSNVRLPIGLERLLNLFLVTPRMHGIHHSQVRREANSNYGVVFPWWDRLHRTLGLNIPQAEIVTGIPGYSRPEDNQVARLIAMPFLKQRDYWRKPDGTVPEREATDVEGNPTTLAE